MEHEAMGTPDPFPNLNGRDRPLTPVKHTLEDE